MNKTTIGFALAFVLTGTFAADAATFTPSFDTPAFPGTQYDVGATENAYYQSTFGISVSNAYLYVDVRDTIDGIGIANGNVGEIGSPQAGRIDFLDTTDFVTIDFLAILQGVYAAYDATGSLLSSFIVDGTGQTNGLSGTQSLSGGIISYVLFSGSGGYAALSGLTYNYDGITDGHNDDLPSAVPLPAGGVLLLGALAGLAGLRRRRV